MARPSARVLNFPITIGPTTLGHLAVDLHPLGPSQLTPRQQACARAIADTIAITCDTIDFAPAPTPPADARRADASATDASAADAVTFADTSAESTAPDAATALPPAAAAAGKCFVRPAASATASLSPTPASRAAPDSFAASAAPASSAAPACSAAESLDPARLHDSLTHLPGAQLFRQRLDECVRGARRAGHPLAVLSIDLDDFAALNARHGPAFGDAVLRQVATRLYHTVRRSDVLARTGADEFGLVATVLNDRPGGAHVASRVLEALRRPMTIAGQPVILSASVGVAIYPHDGQDGASLLSGSVTALQRAKVGGQNRFEYLSPQLHSDAVKRLSIEHDLRHALERQQFELHYQPLVDAHGRVISAEALLRWRHPQRGLVPPGVFIPVAEQTGLIAPIGAWVVRETVRQAAFWRAGGLEVRVACNVSPVQFAVGDFYAVVKDALAGSGLPPTLLELEVTEGLLMNDSVAVAQKLACLRGEGVRVAVDDFGAGYSSLSRLHHLPIDTLKVDRTFTSEVRSGRQACGRNVDCRTSLRQRTAVVRSVVALAQNLGLHLVAEGVENDQQFRFLRRIGYDALQGFLFSRPVPADEFPAVVTRLGLASATVSKGSPMRALRAA